jgi:hypothetical protein
VCVCVCKIHTSRLLHCNVCAQHTQHGRSSSFPSTNTFAVCCLQRVVAGPPYSPPWVGQTKRIKQTGDIAHTHVEKRMGECHISISWSSE